MINRVIRQRTCHHSSTSNINDLTNNLIKSRNLFNVQTIQYELVTVTSMDLDDSNTFLLVGLSNGGVDLLEIEDPRYGTLGNISRFNFSQSSLNRLQWSPSCEQFFSMLDNHDLYLVDPAEMRTIERFEFGLKTNWSEWNPNDQKVIAVCGSESQIRLVDISCGSSVQTIILGAPSGLVTHRATRCLWSNHDMSCLFIGDNEGYIHVYDTRHSTRPLMLAGKELGQISGMSFTQNNCSIITSQGSGNQLVQWHYDKCTLKPDADKFKKRPKMVTVQQGEAEQVSGQVHSTTAETRRDKAKKTYRRIHNHAIPLPADVNIRCQFHVTERHVICPASWSAAKSKEIYIYDLKTGERIKKLMSTGILDRGVYSVTSLLPESLTIFVGGRGRLRVWSLDEDYQRKEDERMRRYHQTCWESGDEA